LGTFKADI